MEVLSVPQNTRNFEANAKPVIVNCAFLWLNYMSFQFIKFIACYMYRFITNWNCNKS